MSKTLNVIWFSNDGSIPNSALDNLAYWSSLLNNSDCKILLWTDSSKLNKEKTERLNKNIKIHGIDELHNHRMYGIIKQFVQQGHSGDYASYAVASDILRIVLLEIAPKKDVFIYADCNDIKFNNLSDDLLHLEERLAKTTWGMVFPIVPLINNDVIAACKMYDREDLFFTPFFECFYARVNENYPKYRRPANVAEANKNVFPIGNILGLFDKKNKEIYLNKVNLASPIDQINIQLFLQHEHCEGVGLKWHRNLSVTVPNSSHAGIFSWHTPIVYKNGPVELLSEGRYAQSKEGKRYIRESNQSGVLNYYKIVNNFKREMEDYEIQEFAQAISEFDEHCLQEKNPSLI